MGAVCLLQVASAAAVDCWTEAEQRYGVSASLLYAIAMTESSLRESAVNDSHRARTQSYDIGIMQINSRWLPTLARYGISEQDLYNACTNIHVGAWLLSRQFRQKGLTWDSVGAYNAACTSRKGADCTRARAAYANKVFRHLRQVQQN
jgi:soluble lytic murein transglycosylase-like protein